MAGGWAKDGAVQEQIDASVEDAVRLARQQLPSGQALSNCTECGDPIPEARRLAIPGVQYCIDCQQEREKQSIDLAGYNRRGSKDSQIR